MNLFLFQLLPLIAFLAYKARSSALPAYKEGPPNPERGPCYSKFRKTGTWISGTCIDPNDSYQCDDGITANTEDCGRSEHGRLIHCCLHLSCNSRWSGRCQNNFKNCDGEWTVSDTAPGVFGNYDVPIHNPCPEPDLVTCCTPKDKMGPWKPGESSMIPDSALFSAGLCSKKVTPDLCLNDKNQIGSVFQIPGDSDAQSSLPQQLEGQSYLDNTGGDQGLLASSFGLGQQTQIEDNSVVSSPPPVGPFTSGQEEDKIQPVAALGGGRGGVEPGTAEYAQLPNIAMGGKGDDGAGNQIIPAAYDELTNPSRS